MSKVERSPFWTQNRSWLRPPALSLVLLAVASAALAVGCSDPVSFRALKMSDLIAQEAVPIGPGTLVMGCDGEVAEHDHCNDNELSTPQVTLTRPFDIMATEVTQEMYEAVLGYNPSYFLDCGGDCPVDNVAWETAIEFITEFNRILGLDDCSIDEAPYDCEGWRLPTEAEWEYAARAGEDTVYPGSNSAETVAWYGNTSHFTSHPVCSLERNALGLCDMGGNVWEWTWDYYQELLPPEPAVDPYGPDETEVIIDGHEVRVVRGGGWRSRRVHVRVSSRYRCPTHHALDALGFRLVRTIFEDD